MCVYVGGFLILTSVLSHAICVCVCVWGGGGDSHIEFSSKSIEYL